MNSGLPPEQRRDKLASRFNDILSQALSDKKWTGDATDHTDVLDYGELSRAQGDVIAWADAAWLASVLLEREGKRKLETAELILAELQQDQDLVRRNVADLGLRARVTGKYGFLPARLAALRYRLDKGASALFDAIEWAKCRALSDAAGDEIAPRFDDLLKALAGTRTHYLTYLIDYKESFAVLVTADGKASVDHAPIGRKHIRGYDNPEKIHPDGRFDKTANAFFPKGDWRQKLAPLAELVDAAVKAKRIGKEDTLLISPHNVLHLFPLHELLLPSADGCAIGEIMAVVRVHGAADVLRRINAGPPVRPKRAVAVWAPLQEELADVDYAGAFRRCTTLLKELIGEVIPPPKPEEATASFVLDELGLAQLLHLACHGDFLPKGPAMERSILVLSSRTQLPKRLPSDSRAPAGALTPSLVLNRAKALAVSNPVPFHDTHVTLQACVSGHAAANPQGDAVGLEWAFLMAGAASTLGTHWHVDRDDATLFTETFYATWLGGASRATAWAAGGDALRKSRSGAWWAGFSLTGEWR
ncbi:CHAT domain-containing protein [Nitrosospira multiformis]|uniref:CHAT domain-containing protein n=1 Tax=Nitrosospira multiformis TaxID=1231 RepID=UPI000898C187|nr:CHAT domain-containing protein [Nitrosospira multiformis]SEA62728.1 CHAT domain-containing protein [Nitrosospira multiformis]